MNKQTLKIGFIGLGKMGSGICSNLQRAGYSLTVYNRSIEKTTLFADQGAQVATSIKQLAEQSDIIFSSVLDDNALDEICQGQNGLFSANLNGKIHVGLTTIQPTSADRLQDEHQQLGCDYIAAPVVGRPDAASAGKLISFLAGDSSAIRVIEAMVETYTVKHIVVGEAGNLANSMKICVNYMAMAQLAMLGEIFAYGEKSQLDQALLLKVTQMFFAGNTAMVEYAHKIATRDFDTVEFNLSAGLKDAFIFDKAFTERGVKPSAIQGAKDNLIAANANGLGDKDWSALSDITRQLAGLNR